MPEIKRCINSAMIRAGLSKKTITMKGNTNEQIEHLFQDQICAFKPTQPSM